MKTNQIQTLFNMDAQANAQAEIILIICPDCLYRFLHIRLRDEPRPVTCSFCLRSHDLEKISQFNQRVVALITDEAIQYDRTAVISQTPTDIAALIFAR